MCKRRAPLKYTELQSLKQQRTGGAERRETKQTGGYPHNTIVTTFDGL